MASFPSETVLRAFWSYESIPKIYPLSSPWSPGRVFKVLGDPPMVLKSWSGLENLEKLHNEIEFVTLLSQANFEGCVRQLKTTTGNPFFAESPSKSWSAYEFIEGTPVKASEPCTASDVGKLVASLHVATMKQQIATRAGGRFYGLSELANFLSDRKMKIFPKHKEFLELTELAMTKHLLVLKSLPINHLHGDLNFNNMIRTSRGIRLIDFEFSRIDSRLFDLAALMAPMRDENEHFIIPSKPFLMDLLRSYQNELDLLRPVTHDEKRLFPLIILLHFLFIAHDISKVVPELLDRPMRVANDFLVSFHGMCEDKSGSLFFR